MLLSSDCRICLSKDYEVLLDKTFQKPETNIENIIKREDYNFYNNYVDIYLNILFKYIVNHKINYMNISINKCNKCGFVFFSPCPDQDDLIRKYKEIDKLGVPKLQIKNIERRQKRVYSLITRCISDFKTKKTILDYGGHRGDNLKYFFNTHKCYVLDYVPDNYYKEIIYIKGDIDELKQELSFDIILLQHTLEHIFDPVNYLKKLSKFLNSNGYIYMEYL